MGTVEAESGENGERAGTGHDSPAQQPLEGGRGKSREQRAVSRSRDGGTGRGMGAMPATEEERAAILAMLSKRVESAQAGAGAGRASAWAWAGLRLAGIVLLAAGVGIGLGDGDEFDDVGCSVAQQPGGTSHGAHSAKTRERAGAKLPGSDGGSAGGSGDGGPAGRPELQGVESKDLEVAMPGVAARAVVKAVEAAIERILGGP